MVRNVTKMKLKQAGRRVANDFSQLGLTQRLALAPAAVAVVVALVAWVPLAPAADDPEPQLREFTLTAAEVDWEFQPGATVRAWAYNGQVPGPEFVSAKVTASASPSSTTCPSAPPSTGTD